ncbi:hypothetical protein LXL04_000778 [Taraxacum kok-saghyz]
MEIAVWPRRRSIRDGAEREEESRMIEIISALRLNLCNDSWILPAAPNESFSTTWIRDRIETLRCAGQISLNIWQKEVPKKVNILMWRIINKRIPVREELSKMGIDIPSTLCPFCENEVESISHLLFECNWSGWLWTRMGLW